MQDFISEIAKLIGIDPGVITGSGATLSGLMGLYALKYLLAHQKTEDKQVGFEQKLVDMAANAIEAYQKNTKAVEASTAVLTQLVTAVKDMSVDLPLKLAQHEASMVTTFVAKADEMHKVVERRDMEHEQSKKVTKENHEELVTQLNILKKEITDATDETTLRSAIDRIVAVLHEMVTMLKDLDKAEPSEPKDG